MTGTVRALVVSLTACAALLLMTAPARAHNTLTGSDPENGARLTALPGRVTLTFDQAVRPDFARIAVTGPDGARYEQGDVGVSGTSVFVGVRTSGPAGTYAIGYRVVSNDGHPVSGTITFTVTGTGAGPVTPSAGLVSPSPGGGPPGVAQGGPPAQSGGWVWGLLTATAVLLALSALVLVRHDRRMRSAT